MCWCVNEFKCVVQWVNLSDMVSVWLCEYVSLVGRVSQFVSSMSVLSG